MSFKLIVKTTKDAGVSLGAQEQARIEAYAKKHRTTVARAIRKLLYKAVRREAAIDHMNEKERT